MNELTLDRPTVIPGQNAPETTLNSQQLGDVTRLSASIDRDQAIWLSGYFAGVAGAAASLPAAGELGPGAPLAAPTAARPTAGTVTILYASDTGNSKEISGQLHAAIVGCGRSVQVLDVAKYKARSLKDESELLLVVSTHGEGDPPPSALDFFDFLEGRKAPKLPALSFAVLALGDSTYEHFCSAGRRVDERLAELGATRLLERVDCDVDFDEQAEGWIAAATAELKAEAGAAESGAATIAGMLAPPPAASAFNKRSPFTASIFENVALTGRRSSKETRHIELSLEGSGLTYEPGDALGVAPQNDPAMIEALLGALDLSGQTTVTHKDQELRLAAALADRLEITAATPRFLAHWAELAEADDLLALHGDAQSAARAAFLSQHQVIDIVERYPAPGITAEQLIAGLRPLQPRLYSIASSLAAYPEEAHLTVSTVGYELHGRPRRGVASGWLAGLAEEDAGVPVYVQENEHFRLPKDDAKIVMIGAGTGVAPYRAFMQEREERGASGESWLFFGERNFRSDFLYQLEWQELLRGGTLSRLDLAFSRDAAKKVYVQDRIREQGRELYAWLEDGAHLYVCGDAEKLAPDVQAALTGVVAEHGRHGADAAEQYISELRKNDRYLQDVY